MPLATVKQDNTQVCPFDGVKLVSNESPMLSPELAQKDRSKRYRYFKSFNWGWVRWQPQSPYLPQTEVWVNPRQHGLSLQDVKDIVSGLFVHPEFVRVMSYDVAIDLEIPLQVAEKGIWAKRKRRIHDSYKTTVYLGGSHRNREVKIYDKSLQLKQGRDRLTRIEESAKFDKNNRPKFFQWLKNPEQFAQSFGNVVFADLEKLDSRLKAVKIAKIQGVQAALQSAELTPKEKEMLRELLKSNVRIDLRGIFVAQLENWLKSAAEAAKEAVSQVSDKIKLEVKIFLRNISSMPRRLQQSLFVKAFPDIPFEQALNELAT